MSSMQRVAITQAVPVTLDEITQVIQRAYRATKPRLSRLSSGEFVYYLTPDLEDTTNVIRVQTSVFGGGVARGEGEDSIRVVLINTKTDKAIAEKVQRVHRVEGWRDNLRKRINEAIERFDDLKEARDKAHELAAARQEQEQFKQERPEQARSERDRQINLLQFLSESRSRNADKFADMLKRLRAVPGGLLSPKQLQWAEGERNWLNK